MTPILPAALRESLDQVIQGFASAELARRSDAISETYRSGRGSARAIADDADATAYLAARLPATYAAMATALMRVKEHAPTFAPGSLLDAGAGPGTASWAAASLWPSVAAVTMLDRNSRLLALARKLCAGSGIEALQEAQTIADDMTALESNETYDAVLAGYAVAEIPSASLERALDALWKACRGVLVIVEPGTQAGFARIREARDLFLARSARMIAPCPGHYACPIASPDWCHFSVRLPRSRAHMRTKGASVPFEDEKFSYLAVARDTVAIALPKGRIVAEPHAAKPGVTMRVCSDGAIAERMAPRRDKPAYKRAAKAKWGDAFEP